VKYAPSFKFETIVSGIPAGATKVEVWLYYFLWLADEKPHDGIVVSGALTTQQAYFEDPNSSPGEFDPLLEVSRLGDEIFDEPQVRRADENVFDPVDDVSTLGIKDRRHL